MSEWGGEIYVCHHVLITQRARINQIDSHKGRKNILNFVSCLEASAKGREQIF